MTHISANLFHVKPKLGDPAISRNTTSHLRMVNSFFFKITPCHKHYQNKRLHISQTENHYFFSLLLNHICLVWLSYIDINVCVRTRACVCACVYIWQQSEISLQYFLSCNIFKTFQGTSCKLVMKKNMPGFSKCGSLDPFFIDIRDQPDKLSG